MAINEEHAKLERELLDAHNVIQKYHSQPGRWKSITDSEYKAAVQTFQEADAALKKLDQPAPPDPFEGKTIYELQSLYDQKKQLYKGGAGSARQAAELLKISTHIQKLENGVKTHEIN